MIRSAHAMVVATALLSWACAKEDPALGGAPDDDGDSGSVADTGTSGDDDGGTTAAPTGPEDGAITWHRDVRPIVDAACVECHTEGTIAPFPLTSYEEAWPLREAIAAAVSARIMPPWLPGPGCTDYVGDASLSAEQIDTIVQWAELDGPRGFEADYVAPPPSTDVGLSRVDLEVPLPVAYTPTQSPDDYRCFIVPWPGDATTYVTGFRALPDRIDEVHHVIVYAVAPDELAQYQALDDADAEPGYTCFGGPGATSVSAAGRWLGAWAPGGKGLDFPEGVGLRMDPGQSIIVQVHYNTLTSEPAPDQTIVQFRLSPEVEREGFMLLWADIDWVEGNMPIPAGSPSTVHEWAFDPTPFMNYLTDAVPPSSPFMIYSASHHMHRRGVHGRSEILRADGSTECLLDIPRWDFDWQQAFRLATPLRFEPGDTLKVGCEFDNSDGTTDVNWGESTEDEMCLGVYFIASP